MYASVKNCNEISEPSVCELCLQCLCIERIPLKVTFTLGFLSNHGFVATYTMNIISLFAIQIKMI